MPTDYPYWQENNVKVDGRVCRFTNVTNTNPFTGISKPERRCHHKNPALYSRCIDREHRLVYSMADVELTLIACFYDYERV
ncbi:Txe/YoeB family addiction module toxin [Serratia symbiotica]|uniref:Txe/YoeB family addiction module toxin n=1 Tax=Serratia symbiotica TaxID=138074 RepID=UPI001EED0959|nr:Txe/YoeB family addiction module toxin [Serratia symbiotica]